MNREPDQEARELDSFDARLRERLMRHANSTTDRNDVNAIWDAMRDELHCEIDDVEPSKKVVSFPSKSFLSFRSMMTLAAACCLVAFSSIFIVAAKQRSDGTVLSSTTRFDRMVFRQDKNPPTNRQWLPEERELWAKLMTQTAESIDLDSTLVVALSIQQK